MQRDNKIRVRLLLSLMVTMVFLSALFVRCASIGNPTGGPKDTLPPVIMKMTPENFSTNMDTLTKRIYIEFNEFVQITDQQSQFFTSPQMKNKPQLQLKGRGVVVTLRDTLRPNTTYALNFGSTVKDNNENNPLYSMRYVFSTGERIDSLIISGYAEDSYKADSVGGTYILLYPKDSVEMSAEYDSTLFNATPAIISRAENNGIFMAQNLKGIPYYMYALEDTNGNLTYEPGVDRVGFIDGAHNPLEMGEFSIWYDSLRQYVVAEPQLHFRMFMDRAFKRQLLADSSRPSQHKAILNFGANYPQIDSLLLDSIPSDRIILEYPTIGRDTITMWFDMPSEMLPDTIRGRIVYQKHDSLNNLTQVSERLRLTWKAVETKDQQQAREKLERERKRAESRGEEWVEPEAEIQTFKLKIDGGEQINPEQSLVLNFDYPISQFDSTKVVVTRLTVEEQNILEEQRRIEADAARLAAAEAALAEARAAEVADSLAQIGAEVPVAETPTAEATAAAAEKKEYYGEPFPYTITRDTVDLRRWYFDTEWSEPGDAYFVTFKEGTFKDITGFLNDSVTKQFTPMKPEEYGSIIVEIVEDRTTPSHYILELLDSAGATIKERRVGVEPGRIELNYLPAGTYMLRVVQDLNNNGMWDSGDLIQRRQSERAQVYTSRKGEREIETKVNWEIDIVVDPSELFAEESQQDLVRRLDKQERQRLEDIERKKLEALKK